MIPTFGDSTPLTGLDNEATLIDGTMFEGHLGNDNTVALFGGYDDFDDEAMDEEDDFDDLDDDFDDDDDDFDDDDDDFDDDLDDDLGDDDDFDEDDMEFEDLD